MPTSGNEPLAAYLANVTVATPPLFGNETIYALQLGLERALHATDIAALSRVNEGTLGNATGMLSGDGTAIHGDANIVSNGNGLLSIGNWSGDLPGSGEIDLFDDTHAFTVQILARAGGQINLGSDNSLVLNGADGSASFANDMIELHADGGVLLADGLITIDENGILTLTQTDDFISGQDGTFSLAEGTLVGNASQISIDADLNVSGNVSFVSSYFLDDGSISLNEWISITSDGTLTFTATDDFISAQDGSTSFARGGVTIDSAGNLLAESLTTGGSLIVQDGGQLFIQNGSGLAVVTLICNDDTSGSIFISDGTVNRLIFDLSTNGIFLLKDGTGTSTISFNSSSGVISGVGSGLTSIPAGNLTGTFNLQTHANTTLTGYLYANGTGFTANIPASGGGANIGSPSNGTGLATGNGTAINFDANITTNGKGNLTVLQIIGNASQITSVPAGNLTGTTDLQAHVTTGLTGYLIGNGTGFTANASIPVGDLAGNFARTGNDSFGNITATLHSGNGSALSSLAAGNLTGNFTRTGNDSFGNVTVTRLTNGNITLFANGTLNTTGAVSFGGGNSTTDGLGNLSIVGLNATNALGVIQLRSNCTFASGPLSPANITTNQNNYAPGVGRNTELTVNANITITGIVSGQPGEERFLVNVGNSTLTLSHLDGGSTAGNRFQINKGANTTIAPNDGLGIYYSASGNSGVGAWRVFA